VSAGKKARELIAEHEITELELFPQTGGKLGDAVAAADRARDVVASVRAAAADPEVQKGVRAASELVGVIAEAWKKRR
jgi:hypothetical protein